MSEWKTVEFKELAGSENGSFAIGPFGSAITTDNYVPEGVPVVRGVNLARGVFVDDGFVYITDQKADELKRANLTPGDLVFTHRGTIGQVSMIPRLPKFPRYVLSSSQVKARIDFRQALPEFYYYWFRSPEGRRSLLVNTSTVGVPGIASPLATIKSLRVPYPPIQEQRAISAILGALDDKIAVNDRIAATGESLGHVIFRALFGDALAYLADDAALSDGWSAMAFGGVAKVLETGRRPKGGVAGFDSGVPSIGAESIARMASFDFAKVRYVPEDYFAAMKQGVIEDYDILLYKDGGRPGNFEPHVSMFGRGFPFDRMCINEHVYRIRLAKPLSQAYGYYWLASELVMDEMRRRGTGVAIPGLNSSAVRELPIVCPPADLVTRFDDEVVPLIDRAINSAAEAQALSKMRDTLLPKLMSGEIRVRDAEKVVEDAT